MASRDPRRVAVLAYDHLCTFEFGIVVEVFARRRPELNVEWYDLEVCSLERGPIRAMGGIRVEARRGLRGFQQAGTIVIPGWRNADEAPPKALVKALRAAHADGARLVSICSGFRAGGHRAVGRQARDHALALRGPPDLAVSKRARGAGCAVCGRREHSDFGRQRGGDRSVSTHRAARLWRGDR